MKRKQLLSMFLVLILPITAWCQLERGSYLGSASAGISFQNTWFPSSDISAKYSSFNVFLNNSFGIFVANNLAIGPGFNINTGYFSTRIEDNLTGEVKARTTSYDISLVPFIRYYFYHREKVAFFGHLSGTIGYGQDFEKYESPSTGEQKRTFDNFNYGGSLAVGFVYFINRNVGVETSLGYVLRGFETKPDQFNNKMVYGQLSINAGLTFYLGKCKKKEKEKEKEKDASSSQ